LTRTSRRGRPSREDSWRRPPGTRDGRADHGRAERPGAGRGRARRLRLRASSAAGERGSCAGAAAAREGRDCWAAVGRAR
jgi:hypothetical protein